MDEIVCFDLLDKYNLSLGALDCLPKSSLESDLLLKGNP
jgi:hypothetical protein